MTERSKRQLEIVALMIEDALTSARNFERDVNVFAETRRTEEMVNVIQELSDWIEERDSDRLEDVGVTMEDGVDGRLLFKMAGKARPFVVRPRADMSIAAGGRIVHLNPDLPILDEDVYAEVLDRIFVWAESGKAERRRRFN